MVAWGVRAGASGEREAYSLDHGVVAIGFGKVPDLMQFEDKNKLKTHLKSTDPDWPDHSISTWVGQIWAFVHGVKPGDLVALPRKSARQVALGEVCDDYSYAGDAPAIARHQRKVRWLEQDIPADSFDSDLRYSLLSMRTVFQIRPPNAEYRLRASIGTGSRGVTSQENSSTAYDIAAPERPVFPDLGDISRAARVAILTLIRRRFMGHRLEELVAAILEADGYAVLRSGIGRDSGIDLLAGPGLLGFGKERLAVQIKSGQRPASMLDVSAFSKRLEHFHAANGLFVSLSGFSGMKPNDQRLDFFRMRYWDGEALLDAIFRVYDRLPQAIRRELPLQRIWAPCISEAADA